MDAGDEPWGLVALLTAGLWMGFHHRQQKVRPILNSPSDVLPNLWPAILATGVYVLTYGWMPPLVRAGVAVTALTLSISPCWLNTFFHAGLWGLLILSLPIMATFEFFAGYPLRVLITWAGAKILSGIGFPVLPMGTQLEWAGIQVAVDAPCAGIRLLWVGAWLTLTLFVFYGLKPGPSLGVGGVGLVGVIAGNIGRTVALFFLESGMIQGPAWLHAAVGVMAFIFISAGIAVTVVLCASPTRAVSPAIDEERLANSGLGCFPGRKMWVAAGAVWLLAIAIPFWPETAPSSMAGFPGWPQAFEGRPLIAESLSRQENEFAEKFPGYMGKFTDGERVIILRWVARPTRQLHPMESCFKGMGYRIKPQNIWMDTRGRRWGTFLAMRGEDQVRVRTRITDSAGQEWQDVSSWFWAAAGRRSSGPWWTETIVERQRH